MSADHRAGAENALSLGEAAIITSTLPGWVMPGIEFARGQLLATLDLADAMRDLARHQADANAIALAGLGPDARITFLTKQEPNCQECCDRVDPGHYCPGCGLHGASTGD